MSLPVLILRPIDSARGSASRAEELGLHPIVDPLFLIEKLAWTPPPASEFDALLLTSANAMDFAGAEIEAYRNMPVLAVGRTTAAAARERGFDIAETGHGGVDALLDELPAGSYPRILHLTGKHHVDEASKGRQITRCQIYQASAIPLGEKAQSTLGQDCVVLLYSSRAAIALAGETKRLQLNRSVCRIAALSANIASAAGPGWHSVHIAEHTSEDALLSLAVGLCSNQ